MTSKPDTWMPFYVGDYLRKTMHLTAEQHGSFMLLIMACWVNGGMLTDDDEQLAAIARVTQQKWRKMRPTIEPFFQITEGQWHNKRVEAELTKAIDISERARAAGEASAEARRQRKANGKATDVQPNVNETPNETSTERQRNTQRKANQTSTDPPTERQRKGQPKANTSPSPLRTSLREDTTPLRGVKRAREDARESALTREIFANGLKLLGKKYRPLIAKMLEASGKNAVREALDDINRTNPDNPAAAFVTLCNEATGPPKRLGPDGPPPTLAELGWDTTP